MIDHSNCDHPSTSSARAKCRRSIKSGSTPRPQATEKEIDFSGSGGAQSTTPRDRFNACDNCGVERVTVKGTDPVDGILKYVGNRCEYIVRHAKDITPLD